MKTSTKVLSVLLALIMVLSCMPFAFAQEKETDKLKVEIKTDKDKYRVSDEIIFNIKVTNVSDETLKVVDLSTASDDLLIIKGPITRFEDELAPGESIEIAFRARAFFTSENLGFFEKTTAFICSLPYFVNVWYCLWRFWTMWALNPGYDYGVVYNEAPVKVGDSELILRVRASYSIGEHIFED